MQGSKVQWQPPLVSNNYSATPKQLEFHVARYYFAYRAVFCGKGAGKTLCGLAEALMIANENPGSVGFVFSPNYPMMRRNIFPTLSTPWLLGNPFWKNYDVTNWNKADQCLTFSNGSEIWFVPLDLPERAEGANIDYAYIDEARLVRQFGEAWKSVTARLRGSGKCKTNMLRGAYVTTTPDNPGSDLYNVFENPKTVDYSTTIVFRWSIYDNPKLDDNYLKSMEHFNTGGYAKRFIYGQFADVGGVSFDFDSVRNVVSTMPELRSIRYGVDIGWTNPSAIVVVGFDHDGRAYAVDEFYDAKVRTDDLVNEARILLSKYGDGVFVCDRSEPATIDEMQKNNLRATPDESKREDGIIDIGSRLKPSEDGRPRLLISSKCVNLISELQSYDETIKENDHAVDALRYALKGFNYAKGRASIGKVGI